MSGAHSTRSCAEARGLFPAYAEDALSREERSTVREHLAACAECRGEAASTDPAFLFTVLAMQEAPEDSSVSAVSAADTAKILAGVRAGIALKTAEKRIGPASRQRRLSRLSWKRPAMTAAATVAAVTLAWKLAPRPAVPGQMQAEPVAASSSLHRGAPTEFAASPAGLAASPAGPASLRPASLVPAEGRLPGALEPAKTEGKSPADATIYDWNPGGGQPRVVWIVDRSLDI